MNGLLSASEMLRQVAAHYDDSELHEILIADAELLEEEANFPDDDEITISKSQSLLHMTYNTSFISYHPKLRQLFYNHNDPLLFNSR